MTAFLSVSQKRTNSTPEAICLKCGMCCNGVIFADVKLMRGDDAQKLLSLVSPRQFSAPKMRPPLAEGEKAKKGLPGEATAASTARLKIPQPCPAFDGCRCRIYAERPLSCRQFECRLLKRLKIGDITRSQGLAIIRLARRKADKVLCLLRELGDCNEQLALTVRFRRTTRRMEEAAPDKKEGRVYGRLTLAMHELNNVLSEFFYPG